MADIEKRRVTMTNVSLAGKDAKGRDLFHRHEAVDYVPVEILDAYVADARTRWQNVEVGEEHEAGPGGEHGRTVVPAHLNHALAGKTLRPGKE
jgi:hypothetical protein